MKKGKKVIAVALSLTMALTCLSACGNNNSDPKASEGPKKTDAPAITIGPLKGATRPPAQENKADAKKLNMSIWCPAEEVEIMTQLCEDYDNIHPEYDIKFTIDKVSEADASTLLKGDPKKSADVFMFAGDQMASLVKQKLLYNIAALAKDDPSMTTKYDTNAYNSCVIGDGLYGLPFTANQYFMYYNKSMYTEDDVVSLDKMLAKDLGKNVKNYSTELGNGWYIASYFYAGGCTLFGDGTKPTECDWNSEKGVAVVKYLNGLVATDKLHNNANDDSLSMLKKKELAAWTIGSWKSNEIRDALGADYAAAIVPKVKIGDTEGQLTPFADFKDLGVNALTKDPQAAALLAYFLADEYAQTVRLEVRAYAPTIKTLQESTLITDDVDAAVKAATLQMMSENSVLRPTTTQIDTYWSYGAAIGGFVVGKDKRVTDDKQLQGTLDKVVKGITTVN